MGLLARRSDFHILIVGLDHAGKTSILERLKAIFMGIDPLMPSKIPPTVGLNIGRMKINQRQLIFWDLGGSSSLRSLWEKCVHCMTVSMFTPLSSVRSRAGITPRRMR